MLLMLGCVRRGCRAGVAAGRCYGTGRASSAVFSVGGRWNRRGGRRRGSGGGLVAARVTSTWRRAGWSDGAGEGAAGAGADAVPVVWFAHRVAADLAGWVAGGEPEWEAPRVDVFEGGWWSRG